MQFKTAKSASSDLFAKKSGTCLQGYVDASYEELVKLFGKPLDGDGHKVDAEWCVQFEDGTFSTIYNYKDGPNYLGGLGKPVEKIRDWHVGGNTLASRDRVQIALDLFRETLEDSKKSDVEKAFAPAFDMMDSIAAAKGKEYAMLVEMALMVKKQAELMVTLTTFVEEAAGIPKEITKIVCEANASMGAKILSRGCTLAGVPKTKDRAGELMSWVDRLTEAESAGAETLLKDLTGGKK